MLCIAVVFRQYVAGEFDGNQVFRWSGIKGREGVGGGGQVIRFQDIFVQGRAVCVSINGLLTTRYFVSTQHGEI